MFLRSGPRLIGLARLVLGRLGGADGRGRRLVGALLLSQQPEVTARERRAADEQQPEEDRREAAAAAHAPPARALLGVGQGQRELERAHAPGQRRLVVVRHGQRELVGGARARHALAHLAAGPVDARERRRLLAVDLLEDDVLALHLARARDAAVRRRVRALGHGQLTVPRAQRREPALELGLTHGIEHGAQDLLDVVEHLLGALVAHVRIELHGAPDDRAHVRGQIGRGDLRGTEVGALHAQQHLEIRGRLEGAHAHHELVEHRPEREEIGARVDGLSERLLGRHERHLALHDARPRLFALAHGLGDAEVRELHLALLRQKNVLGADVAVNDAERPLARGVHLAVRVGERAADLGRDVQAELARQRHPRHRGALEHAAEVPAVDDLHDEEIPAAADAEVEDLHDVAVRQAHRDVGLVDEHVAELRIRVDRAVDPLEDHGLLEALAAELHREEDLGHAAVRDLPDDLVAAVLRHRPMKLPSVGRAGLP